ncbi:AsnC family transcriptional regulator [Pedobacter sp. HMF7647]|uniref:AsnC family transcriptional regulator n=1 Tax=Hufsiella arboris TaxID=2695275 RepID=A0A7K1Y5V6_9SPHI|nr:Lrp/AsnC family transcriptional regulator [Hufsiella arboris]MXV49955.1 AsnC family transcriptional regulator [Hufsiella arboris]
MISLDSLDLKILTLLQQDARQTSKEIGAKVHKSITAIYERIKRMEQHGVIKRYVAILDNKQLNRQLIAFTNVQLKDHSKEGMQCFESTITTYEEVMECYHISGTYDFILKVAACDLAAYHQFLMDKIFSSGAIAHVESSFVMKESKMETAIPLHRESAAV